MAEFAGAKTPDGVDPAAWAGLLRWSMKCQAEGDGTRDTDVQEMSQEKREFLERVMKEGVVDSVQRADEIIKELAEGTGPCLAEGATLPDDKVDELANLSDELQDIVEQIDFAKALVQIGGVSPLLRLCDTTAEHAAAVPSEIRSGTLAILATVAQNNPYAQDAFLTHGALEIFAGGVASTASSPSERVKALHALSCLVRGHPAAEAAFHEGEGHIDLLARCMEVQDSAAGSQGMRLRRKATFLLFALVGSEHATSGQIEACFMPLAPLLVAAAEKDSDVDLREHTVRALTAFATRGFAPQLTDGFGERLAAVLAACQTRAASATAAADADDDANAAAELALWSTFFAACSREGGQ